MVLSQLTEQKALVFHRAVLGLLEQHPNVRARALDQLEHLRADTDSNNELCDRWAALLDLPIDEMAGVVLADTPDGGLLRANSPFTDALTPGERNSIWRRIGLVQFMGYYLDAAADLALELSDQAAITGIAIEELTIWQSRAPLEIDKEHLQRLKLVVALHKTLVELAPDRDVRRRWLREESATFKATPLTLLSEGKAGDVLDNLAGSTKLTLGPDNLPRMGN
ncbi:MAG: hypothetical protein HOK06_02035 [Rhodospirillaceae bacterium]|jgi:hypothetical protein|nr:hypothetical protein [Rhodospirillaceae bacterium]MBT4218521.1 hypothetical protein [Rhodospirillaceae bacterium]MBT4463226.1 hypothetical protein [Rhodospirillaceae bacterium]MBT5012964.1 hypothetical protein [Rhodospirillaceae bacterium]MBT6406358.1 hypothetical protein [Rhodospirillaceae bacterium]